MVLGVDAAMSRRPRSLADLTFGERLLVWSLRHVAGGRPACPAMVGAFADACGAVAADACHAFVWFVRECARLGRRDIRIGTAGSGLTADERLFLEIFAAAQAQELVRLRAHLAWLLGGARNTEALEAATLVVAMALAIHGHRLPLPAAPTPRAPAEATPLRRA